MRTRLSLLAALLAIAAAETWAQQPQLNWPNSAPSKVAIAPPSEPGQRMVVSGKVVDGAGRPLAGAMIHAYHTDAGGRYREDGSGANWPSRPARLQAYAQTDAEGRYEFATIKPGSYPNTRIPAHVHFHVRRSDGSLQEDEIWFSGDPLLTQEQVARSSQGGTFAQICAVTTDSAGVQRCTHDFKLK